MQALFSFATLLLRCVLAFFRTRREQAIVELALRQQLAAYAQRRPRPRVTSLDRAFWVALHRLWPRWKEVLVFVKPETVVRWHRKGFRVYWQTLSRRGPGRPRVPQEVRELIRRLAFENGWGARKLQGELAKLGFTTSLATVSRYLPKRSPDPGQRQRWMTFLRNHQDAIAAMDFCIVPTVSFQLLYVWFVIDHGRRRLIHFNVTKHPSARWVVQQLREAFPSDRVPRYLLLDRDSIFSAEVMAAIRSFGIDPVRTAYRSPWQNAHVERFHRTLREDALNHFIFLCEDHIRRVAREFVAFYNGARPSQATHAIPEPYPELQKPPAKNGRLIALPVLGGIQHDYRLAG
jgi:transposase InsO family protein